MFFYYLILFIGVFAASTSALFVKLSHTDPVLLASYRSLIAGVVLLPLFFRALKSHAGQYRVSSLRRTLMPGMFLGIHFITWTIGARLTPVSNSTLIVNMLPVITPFLLYFMIREVINRAECYGTFLSLAGVAVLGFADYRLNIKYALGDIICFVSMLFYAFYIVWGRKNRDIPSLWLYVVPLYLIAGLFTLLIYFMAQQSGFTAAASVHDYDARDLGLIFALALIPTVIGHSIFNYSLKHLRGQSVSIIALSQFIFAGFMGVYILNEFPSVAFYLASTLLVMGAIVVIFASRPGAGYKKIFALLRGEP